MAGVLKSDIRDTHILNSRQQFEKTFIVCTMSIFLTSIPLLHTHHDRLMFPEASVRYQSEIMAIIYVKFRITVVVIIH